MLNFGRKFGIFCLLDNHGYEFDKSYECLAGAGCLHSMCASEAPGLGELDEWFGANRGDWIFGHLSYDLKNEIEPLTSGNFDGVAFPTIHFLFLK